MEQHNSGNGLDLGAPCTCQTMMRRLRCRCASVSLLECSGKNQGLSCLSRFNKRSDINVFVQQVPDPIRLPSQGLTTLPNGSVLSLKNVAVGLAAKAALVELHAVLKLPTVSILRLIIP